MSTILSLCRLDFYKLLLYRRMIAAMLIISVLSAVVPAWIPFIYIVSVYMIGVTLIAFDEQYKSNYLYCTLPITRQQVIAARFFLYFILALGLFVGYSVLTIIGQSKLPALDMQFLLLGICFAFNLIFVGLIQALCFRFKFSTVRIIAIIGYLIALVTMSTSGAMVQQAPKLSGIVLDANQSMLPLWGIILIIALVVFGFCYWLSQKLYLHKDFVD